MQIVTEYSIYVNKEKIIKSYPNEVSTLSSFGSKSTLWISLDSPEVRDQYNKNHGLVSQEV